jgi:hypothetical protein
MQTDFILQLDDSLITPAKLYAECHSQSLSQLVAEYFRSLAPQKRDVNEEFKDNGPLAIVVAPRPID